MQSKSTMLILALLILATVATITTSCEPPEPAILLTFDDGYVNHYTVAYPLMKERDLRGVSFIITSLVDTEDIMNEQQITELADNGWEIGSHQVTSEYWINLSPKEMEYELTASKQWIQDNLDITPITFSYAGGCIKDWPTMRTLVPQHYTYARTGYQGTWDGDPSPEIHSYWPRASNYESIIETAVTKAKSKGESVVFGFHKVQAYWFTPALDLIMQSGLPVKTFMDLQNTTPPPPPVKYTITLDAPLSEGVYEAVVDSKGNITFYEKTVKLVASGTIEED